MLARENFNTEKVDSPGGFVLHYELARFFVTRTSNDSINILASVFRSESLQAINTVLFAVG